VEGREQMQQTGLEGEKEKGSGPSERAKEVKFERGCQRGRGRKRQTEREAEGESRSRPTSFSSTTAAMDRRDREMRERESETLYSHTDRWIEREEGRKGVRERETERLRQTD
jgi:hypothetical protein